MEFSTCKIINMIWIRTNNSRLLLLSDLKNMHFLVEFSFHFHTLYSTVCDEPFREKENKISTPLQLVLQSKLIIQPISASHLLQPCISFNRTLEVESTATRNLPSGEPRYNNYSASFSLCHAESF